MSKVISIINNKGGVGKTTSCACIGEILAFLGKKVLLVDIDPQGNLSMLYGGYYDDSNDGPEPKHKNIAELFKYRYKTADEMHQIIYEASPDKNSYLNRLHILPATHRHEKSAHEVTSNLTGNNFVILKRGIDAIQDEYDYIIIDNAPANNILTVNSMMTSDLVYIPVCTEGFSYQGLQTTMKSIMDIKSDYCLDRLVFGGVFITQSRANTNVYKGLSESYADEFKDKFFKSTIRLDTVIQDCESKMIPLLSCAKKSAAVADYFKLVEELKILDKKTEKLLRLAFVDDSEQ